MKRLTLAGLVLVLATGSGMALADRDRGHGGHHGGHGHGYKHGHHKGHWYPRPYYRRVYYSHHDHHSDYYYPLGAALIGAAVTYSLFHSHDAGYSEPARSSDVVGCHRIERYPDGSERRGGAACRVLLRMCGIRRSRVHQCLRAVHPSEPTRKLLSQHM
jgi:hypothetical protein